MPRNAALDAAASDRIQPDHYPACPRCGNLCGVLAVICADCGARLYLEPEDRYPRLRRREAMQATRERGN